MHSNKARTDRDRFLARCRNAIGQNIADAPLSSEAESGATMVEAAMIGAVLVIALVGSILYLQNQTENRINTGRSTFGCAQMCEPGVSECICNDTTGDCSCQ